MKLVETAGMIDAFFLVEVKMTRLISKTFCSTSKKWIMIDTCFAWEWVYILFTLLSRTAMLCHKIENHFRSFFVAMLRTEFCFMSVDPESQIVSLFCNAFYRLLTVLKLRGEGHSHMLVLREGHRRHRRHRGTGACWCWGRGEGHRRHRGTVTWPLDNTFSASRMLFRASLCNTTQKIAVCSVLAMSSV